jgi:hypothetical protein
VAHLLLSAVLVVLATAGLVLGLVTDAGVPMIALSILASVGAGVGVGWRRRDVRLSSG